MPNWSLGFAALTAISMVTSNPGASAAVAASPSLDISLAAPRSSDESPPLIALTAGSPQISVVFTNKGEGSVRLWSDSCSWGYESLSFELTDSKGRISRVTRAELVWDKNVPAWDELASGASRATDVTLSAAAWRGLPKVKPGERRAVRIRAIYHVEPDSDATAHHVWVGAVRSVDMAAILLN
jgi:hypothetical protein